MYRVATKASDVVELLVLAALWGGSFLFLRIAAPYTQQQFAGVPPVAIAIISQLSAAIFLLPALPFTLPKTVPPASILLAVLALALFCTSITYLLYFRLIQNVGSTMALTVTYLVPAFAILWGAIFLTEPITMAMVFGCGLVLLGTAIANNLFSSLFTKK